MTRLLPLHSRPDQLDGRENFDQLNRRENFDQLDRRENFATISSPISWILSQYFHTKWLLWRWFSLVWLLWQWFPDQLHKRDNFAMVSSPISWVPSQIFLLLGLLWQWFSLFDFTSLSSVSSSVCLMASLRETSALPKRQTCLVLIHEDYKYG